MSRPHVHSLHIYPLKSAKGIEVDTLSIDAAGARFDREWMLVKKKTKSFLSQRTHPKMSQLTTLMSSNALQVEFPGVSPITLPLEHSLSENIEVLIFGKPVIAERVGAEQDAWFSEVLGTEVFLVRTCQNNRRTTSGNHGPITPIRFPDGYPFLLTNTETLSTLNARLPEPIEMTRFRPNIVISGAKSDIEDQWQSFVIGSLSFLAVKACTRCSIIDVNPNTGNKSPSVSTELKKYRRDDGNILFGVNLSHTHQGTIKKGSPLINIVEK